MAWSDAALVQVIAPANGTNNYVLADPASQGPLRTDLQAEADGSLSDGDLIHYMVRRITTTGDAEFERGYGAWTKSTRVLARTAGNVLDSDGGPGVLKDWGLSGQMDVYFLAPLDGSDIPSSAHATFATNLGLPRLAAANVFTANQKIDNPGATLTLDSNSGAPEVEFQDNGVRRIELKYILGSQELRFLYFQSDGSTNPYALHLGSGGIADGAGDKYHPFSSGAKILWGSVPDPGWTRVNETQSRVIRLAKSGDTIGSTGGVDDIFDGSWQTAGHTLVESEIPSHTHGQRVLGVGGGATIGPERATNITSFQTGDVTAATGGGGSHPHDLTTPFYSIACWATKD